MPHPGANDSIYLFFNQFWNLNRCAIWDMIRIFYNIRIIFYYIWPTLVSVSPSFIVYVAFVPVII